MLVCPLTRGSAQHLSSYAASQNAAAYGLCVAWDARSVSWYSGGGYRYQLNESGVSYTYHAFAGSDDAVVISFSIDGVQYNADLGMTWAEWIESDYNTDGKTLLVSGKVEYYVDDTNHYPIWGDSADGVFGTDVIVNGYGYHTE